MYAYVYHTKYNMGSTACMYVYSNSEARWVLQFYSLFE